MKKMMKMLALLLALCMMLTACGGEKKKETKEPTKDENPDNTVVLQAKNYVILPGDYCCVAGTTVTTADPSIVSVVKDNLIYAQGVGTTTLTATDGKTTVTHTVKVVSLDIVTLGSDYQTVSEKEFQTLFDQEKASFMANYAEYTEVTDRTDVREGDKVSIDYVGKIAGVAFEGGTGSYDLIIGSNSFIAGFEQGLIGAQNGSTVDLDLTFPEVYPNNPDLQNKAVVFTVTINKIAEPEEYNDTLVKKITGYDTVQAFEEYLRTTIATDMMFQKLTKNSQIGEIPQEVKNSYYNAYVDDMLNYLASMGMTVATKEEVITMMGYTEESFDEMVWQTLGNTVEQDYVFYSYCAAKGIKLTSEDYNANLARYLEMYNCESEAALLSQYGMTSEALYQSFLYEKVMNELYKEVLFADVD